jgi:REP element-mobilizing transposase RayT
VRQLLEEQGQIEKRLAQISVLDERMRQADLERRRIFGAWDKHLDRAQCGPFWLGDDRVAGLMAESYCHLDNQRYILESFCIMPNHVHCVLTPLESDGTNYSMSSILHSLKRHTALQANRIMKRKGTFWQHENYDRVVRDERELNRIIAYVLNNPVATGLVSTSEEWKWSYCRTSL